MSPEPSKNRNTRTDLIAVALVCLLVVVTGLSWSPLFGGAVALTIASWIMLLYRPTAWVWRIVAAMSSLVIVLGAILDTGWDSMTAVLLVVTLSPWLVLLSRKTTWMGK